MIELAPQTQDVYKTLCQHFHDATGWPLQFARLKNETVEDLEARILNRGESCWWKRIDDGTHCIGLIVVGLPDGPLAMGSREAVIGLAESLAVVISKQARAELELSEQSISLRAFSGLQSQFRVEGDQANTIGKLLAAAARLAGYQSASFYLLSPDTTHLKLRLVYGIDRNELPDAHREVASSWPDAEALLHGFSFVERSSDASDRWLPRTARFGVSVPVNSFQMPFGTLWVYDSRPHRFPDRELESLWAVAGHLALVLERTTLLREAECQRRIQSELRFVSEHQNRASRPQLSEDCGLEATYRCLSRHEVGGDLCELLPLADSSTVIAMGDASGNSIPAALVANAVKGALKSMSGCRDAAERHPSVVMDRLNRSLDNIAGDHQFVSLFYADYEATTKRLRYCNAGHPPPILIRNGQVSLLEAEGFLLGILEDLEYECVETELCSGDLVVVYTDGISETHGENDQLFGHAGIVKAVEEIADKPVAAILDAIWNQSEIFAGADHKNKSDDRSLMVLRIRDSDFRAL